MRTPFLSWWTFEWFPPLPIVNSAAMNICVPVFKTNLFFKIFLWLFIAYLGDKSRPGLPDCLPSLLCCLCLCVFVSVPPAPFICWINTLQDQLRVPFSMRSLLTWCQPLCWQAEPSPGSFVPHFLLGTSLWLLLFISWVFPLTQLWRQGLQLYLFQIHDS